jgi:L-threonylcarbamoyladenylate synthase
VPITWLAPPTVNVPDWITGEHERVAVRIVAHPVAAAICTQLGSAIVSTSANRSGQAPARTAYVLRRKLGDLVDYVVPGRCGPFRGPSEIRDLLTGSTIRQSGK